ncbi:MAG: hypothetical protein A2008_10895 [Candidatus Wallbacteria bacterium GWC2_49_35]|uniref:Uncharacterized protein n=1 Tax=Candidatus Wallbacteria bacterium GWC2_49_35 TaxID=1817813 RepID=A0A1F7WGQ6_9BACT|nr:MAG: hypothetical protein A2008_10895 [Candidatus Wallbacteria bacterium GWC2_49_35]HBC73283.1 hypothetical protein [Candidatus Wallbacteria bacterium]
MLLNLTKVCYNFLNAYKRGVFNLMIRITIKWVEQTELVHMKIHLGKKNIFDDLISKISLKEIREFLDDSLKDDNFFRDKHSGENILSGDISEDDFQELCEYFDIEASTLIR